MDNGNCLATAEGYTACNFGPVEPFVLGFVPVFLVVNPDCLWMTSVKKKKTLRAIMSSSCDALGPDTGERLGVRVTIFLKTQIHVR